MPAFRLSALTVLVGASFAHAHYHMLLPDKPAVKAGEAVTLTYQFGHPFEHELSDAAEPEVVYVVHPDATRTDLKKGLKKVAADGPEGKVTAYQFAFTPPKKGDYIAVAVSPMFKGGKRPYQDVTKVVVHVESQKGWDNDAVDADTVPFDLQPLTRPYGLTPGTAFHVDVLAADGKPVRRAPVEVERYNATAPKALPADEFVTRTHRTSRTGTAVVTLGEPGWWGVTATRDGEKEQHRCTLWVYVDAAAK